MYRNLKTVILGTLAAVTLAACSGEKAGAEDLSVSAPAAVTLTTFKSATCGCCGKWVEHARHSGFEVTAKDVDDLNAVKAGHAIAPRHQSCHTSVSPEGYVFEGHIPAKYIRQFLQNPPAGARGLAVPAMPLGSPGMEVGDRFTPYDIVLLHEDGSESVYARVNDAAQQH
ncbi:DUF411 domain-containing protein [Microbulbifer yueqingensis]|uniref:Uncharacterized conserved protein n=1 Tax=Microbulbifer yueqingensis TaxID=658219 RepID=A0A1G8Y1T9_9GAMM|nr:DUF411 domain-containing protein [Microbulbifer yueqingensis]SDJ96819.1 Uncharacterized conserved protein [Microbulbifer yueqingensis]